MENSPRVEIGFLTDYELEFVSYSSLNGQADLSNLNADTKFNGKKGFHLSGGNVDENGEVSGCLLDGTFTFYNKTSASYKGYMGENLSGDDYTFSTPEYIEIKAKNSGTYIKDIIIQFDSVANEYATELYFSDALNEDGTYNTKYTSAYKIQNNKTLFVHSFGTNSTLRSIKLNITKWSKKNALVKITKIRTGYTGNYSYKNLQSVKWDNFKFAEENELTFGVSSNRATLEINDSADIIDELYAKNLILQNAVVNIYIDDILQGSFYIDTKQNERGSDIWVFECVDALERIKDNIVPTLQLDTSGNANLKTIISHVLNNTGITVEYSEEASIACEEYKIPKAYINPYQTVYDVLLKVCQVGMLRMYFTVDKLRITRGI